MTEKRLVSSNYNGMSRCCFLCGVKMSIDYRSVPACCDSCFNSNYKILILQLFLYNSTHLTILRTALINTMLVLKECFISGLWAPIYANMCACMHAHTNIHTHTKKSLKFIICVCVCVYNVTVLQVWYAQAQKPTGYFQPIIKVIFHSGSFLFTTTVEYQYNEILGTSEINLL